MKFGKDGRALANAQKNIIIRDFLFRLVRNFTLWLTAHKLVNVPVNR